MKKKILCLSMLLLFIMALCGCNKVPTAEELVTNAIGVEKEKVDMDIVMNMDVSAEAEGMTMEMGMGMDMNSKICNDISYVEGTVEIEMLGMEIAQDMKMWSDANSGMSYTYTSIYDCWVKQAVEEEVNAEMVTLDIGVYENLLMKEVEKEDTEYVVTATINLGNAYEMMGMDIEDVLGTTTIEFDLDAITMDMTMRFDRETEELVGVTMSAQEDALAGFSQEGISFTELTLDMTINDVAEDFTLEVPGEVIEEAINIEELGTTLEGIY